MPKKPTSRTQKQYIAENEDLRARLDEAEETLRAIRSGEVDALIISGVSGEQIFTLKQAEDALQESEERLRAVLNSAPITIFATDNKGVVTLYEGRGLQRAGMKSGENVGVSAFDLYQSLPIIEHTGKEVAGEDVIRRVLGGETVSGDSELKGVFFDNHFVPLLDTKGQIVGLVGVATDITERKQAEDRIRRQLEHLTALSGIDRVIAGNFDLKLILSEILNHVTIELGIDAADILILNSNLQMLEYGA